MLVAASVATAARVRGTRKPDRLQTVNAVHDVVTCGGGYDLATVDGFDRVGHDCETVTRRTSLDPYRNAFPGHYSRAWQDALAVSPDYTDMVHGALWALVWAVAFTMLAYRRFRRSDILS